MRLSWISALLAALLLLPASGLAAQEVIEGVEDLDFDRPEAWAMKYFTAASLLTGLGPVEAREAGSVDVGLELLSVPHLDREQRTVGFGGFKEENLNRTPVWGRGRVTVGLGGGVSATLAWVPPVEVDGVEANLIALALERPVFESGPWGLGLRLYGQFGETEGDFTCSDDDARFAPGSPENPFGCDAASNDEVTQSYVGLEVVGHYRGRGPRSPTVHAGLAASRLDLEFQVDALTFGFRDRTRLLADGTIYSATVGSSWDVGQKQAFGVELFYSPLDVLRQGETSEENDPLFNLRAMWRVRLR